jgi:hypothetical protein
VNGSGFVATSKVRWNGADRPTTFVSASQLTASIPSSDIAAAGTAQVTVFNPIPGGGTSNAQTFNMSGNARVVGTPPISTATIQEAYDISPTGGIVQIQALDFIENLVCDHPISVKLEGGYDANYTDNSSYTTIHGTVTISNGTVVVRNIIIK